MLEQFVGPKQFNLPHQINGVKIGNISWNQFKGKPNQDLPYSAHIFWNISYSYKWTQQPHKFTVNTIVRVLGKSWYKPGKQSYQLLAHEYGHYLIGCLCAIKFKDIIEKNYKVHFTEGDLQVWMKIKFKQCLKVSLGLQKAYDDQTQHMKNEIKQKQWQNNLIKKLMHCLQKINDKKEQKQKRKKNKQISLRKYKYSNNMRN